MHRTFRRRRRRGFTLIEVLLVLAILVILGSLAVMGFSGVMGESDIKAAKSQIGLFKTPIETYQFTFKQLPQTLQALVEAPGDVDPTTWQRVVGPMYGGKPLPKDPWNNDYKYQAPGTHNPMSYDVWSSGPDGADGTEDDIGNWETVK